MEKNVIHENNILEAKMRNTKFNNLFKISRLEFCLSAVKKKFICMDFGANISGSI